VWRVGRFKLRNCAQLRCETVSANHLRRMILQGSNSSTGNEALNEQAMMRLAAKVEIGKGKSAVTVTDDRQSGTR